MIHADVTSGLFGFGRKCSLNAISDREQIKYESYFNWTLILIFIWCYFDNLICHLTMILSFALLNTIRTG